MVWHELAWHTVPNAATCKRGSAAAISAILSSVKLKVQLATTAKQADVNLREINSWNSIMGVMKTASMGTLG